MFVVWQGLAVRQVQMDLTLLSLNNKVFEFEFSLSLSLFLFSQQLGKVTKERENKEKKKTFRLTSVGCNSTSFSRAA